MRTVALSNGKSPTKQIFDDKKLQKEHQGGVRVDLRDAAVALREAPKKQARGGFGRILIVGIVGAGLALALSEGLRKKVLDALFGAEEEFEYTSTTSSPTTTNAASGNSGATSSTAGTTPAG